MINPQVTVIDYGVGNLLSVQRGLECCGASVEITADPQRVLAASRVVLPGVGAFGNAMRALAALGMVDAIREIARRNTPLLGICLGMQLLFEQSEEFGMAEGLGLIRGKVISLPAVSLEGDVLKKPSIGWYGLVAAAEGAGWGNTLLADLREGDAAYFVHSFMAIPENPEDRIADYDYGGHRIAAVVGRGQITACQFHPEKSGEVGLRILRKFCAS